MWPFAATFAAMLVTISPAQIDHAIESGRIDQARLMIAHAIEEGAAPASLEPSLARIAYKSGAFEEALARGEGMLGVVTGRSCGQRASGAVRTRFGQGRTGTTRACQGDGLADGELARVERAWRCRRSVRRFRGSPRRLCSCSRLGADPGRNRQQSRMVIFSRRRFESGASLLRTCSCCRSAFAPVRREPRSRPDCACCRTSAAQARAKMTKPMRPA